MADSKSIDVCLSPDMAHRYDMHGKVAVVVDILRATSCMVTGLSQGVTAILPFSDLEACRAMRDSGYTIAGERNGQKVEGFDIGNSPYSYMEPAFKGKPVAVTTTNGTVAIEKCQEAQTVLIGAFLNITAVARWLKAQSLDVLVMCAGWKGKPNLEDTLFAGALVNQLSDDFVPGCDNPILAQALYLQAKENLLSYLSQSAHVKRLKNLEVRKDIEFCLGIDTYDTVPYLGKDGHLTV